MVICQVLGAVLLDGTPLSSIRQRRLLAALAIARGAVVSTDRLADAVWDGHPPATTNALQTYVSRLRSVLGTDAVAWRPPGYSLALPDDAVDAWRFETLVDRARDRAPGDALALLDEALGLWHGDPYAEFAEADFARGEAVRLQQLRLAAAAARLDALIDVGRPDEAAADASRLIEVDPYRESLWERRMRALHASGRTTDAVRAFHDFRTQLADETGLEPSAELAALERQLLVQTPAGPKATEGAVAVLALLLTDIERSTMLLQRLGPKYRPLLERHHEIVRGACGRAGGTVAAEMGDGLLLTFATPADAVGAAVTAQRGLAAEAWPDGSSVRTRMAVHVGEVAMTSAGLVGLSIHHAARLASTAHGGQILMSEAARAICPRLPDDVDLRSLGRHDVRDVGPILLHQVVHPTLADAFPPLRNTVRSTNNLPTPLSSLIGRTREISEVAELLGRHRLVTLTGPGGSGKTRLALAVASQASLTFSDGTWFVELAVTTGSEVASAVGTVLRMGDATSEDLLVDAFADRTALLVLDNCEHVVDSVARLCARLLPSCPRLAVLATSREHLRVPGEAVFRVPGLGVPPSGADLDRIESCEAVQLFIARAQLVKPGYAPGGEIDDVVDICRCVDGLPLAIELASARLRSLPAPEIAKRLGTTMRILSGGGRTSLARHQTLEATIEWSFRLLTPPEQQLLVRLAVFSGGADLNAITAICGGPGADESEVLDLVTSLQDKSLISIVEVCGGTVVRLLETVRQFADARLSGSAEADTVRRRHADWFLATARDIRRGPLDGDFDHWVCRLHEAVANLFVAARWCLEREPQSALALLVSLFPAFDLFETGEEPSLLSLLDQAVRAVGDSPTVERAVALAWLAWDEVRGNVEFDADTALREASPQGVDDSVAVAEILAMNVHNRHSLPPGPSGPDDIAVAITAADRTEWFLHRYWARLIVSNVVPAEFAAPLLEEAVAIANRHDHPRLAARARAHLATSAAWSGRSGAAVSLARDALGALIDDTTVERADLYLLALVEAEHGDIHVALQLAEDLAAPSSRRPPAGVPAAGTLAVLAHVRRLAGDEQGALEAAERAARGLHWARGFADVLNGCTRSAIYCSQGRLADAAEVLPAGRGLFAVRGSTDGPLRAIEAWAGLASALGNRVRAADLLATARANREEQHKPPSPRLRRELDALANETASHPGHRQDLHALESVIAALTAEARDRRSP